MSTSDRSLKHVIIRAADRKYDVPVDFVGHSTGYTRSVLVDGAGPSVHSAIGIDELAAGGRIDWHFRDAEESIYVLSGEVVCETDEGAFLLAPGDYALFPVATGRSFRNVGAETARWFDLSAPLGRFGAERDVFFVAPPAEREPVALDVRDPRTRSFGHIDADNMDPTLQTQDRLALSASMRTALLVYSGISVKMMVDSDMGAALTTMFMVQYVPGGFAGAHDHPLEEGYLILDGSTDAVFDGIEYHLEPGDFAFAGVGSTHAFANPGTSPVRWLETQSPQPPSRHSYRFARDWDYVVEKLRD
jgi:mannose-6-phosphate isomerase-like protein (cupin superfamily)